MKQQFELLAPAGSFEILKAVIDAGADAVYVGGSQFGARAYANNFTEEELLEAIDYVHVRGKKLFLTVNTLLKNKEIQEELYQYLLPFYKQGLDAVIVQDFGALHFIHEAFPGLEIHTSTQMTVTGVEGAMLLKELGVTRVVVAREMSIAEMKTIHEKTGLEIEAFVHGALCYSYSGQCLFSSMLGGRSGNRGRCAQPCRLAYSVLNDKKELELEDTYILSLKDLCGIDELGELAQAGVYSLKIEGRMKQVEYAAGVVSYYRKYIDLGCSNVSLEDHQNIAGLGNRCGFTKSYFTMRNDTSMVTYVKPNYETNKLAAVDVEPMKKAVKGNVVFVPGEPATFTVSCEGKEVTVLGNEVQPALKSPVSEEELRKRFCKTGDTPFEFEELSIYMGDSAFLPNGAINQLRRDGLSQLEQILCEKYRRKDNTKIPSPDSYEPKVSSAIWSASVQTKAQLEPVLNSTLITAVYLDSSKYMKPTLVEDLKEDVKKIHLAEKKAYYVLPCIFRRRAAKWYEEHLDELKEIELDGFVIRNYEELWFVKQNFTEAEFVLDHNMYTYNDYAIGAFGKYEPSRITIPVELNRNEIRHRNNAGAEMILYGHYPLMVSAQCVHKNAQQCDKIKTTLYLKDRYQKLFPVKNNCEDCYNVIYNSVPVCLLRDIDDLKGNGVSHFRLNFTIETDKEVATVLRAFENRSVEGIKGEMTNGHFKRGVE